MADCIHNEVRQMVGSSRLVRKSADIALVSRDQLEIGALLGKGAFSEVHEVCLAHDPTRQRYAMKHLKFKLMSQPENFRLAASELAVEAHMLASFDHPNILKIRGWAANGVASFVEGAHDSFFLLLDCLDETLDQRISQWKAEEEFLKRRRSQQQQMASLATSSSSSSSPHNGNLLDVLRWMHNSSPDHINNNNSNNNHDCNTPRYSEEEMQLCMEKFQACCEIASALAYLHESGVIFRDLKPNNIGFLNGHVQLFDFGLSRELPDCDLIEPFEMSGKVGTLRYMAVEVACHQHYNVSADVFSWAMVAYEVLTCNKPFAGWTREMHADLVCRRGMRPDLNPTSEPGGGDIPAGMHPLMQACWDQDPYQRPPMRAVVSQVGYVWEDFQRQHRRHQHHQHHQHQHHQLHSCHPQQQQQQQLHHHHHIPMVAASPAACLSQHSHVQQQQQQIGFLSQQPQQPLSIPHNSNSSRSAAAAAASGITVELPDDFMVVRKPMTALQSENYTAATLSLSAESCLDDILY
ncbi:hypothetical protein ACA910_010134 [Epithemia clementina (nom. ined.)]